MGDAGSSVGKNTEVAREENTVAKENVVISNDESGVPAKNLTSVVNVPKQDDGSQHDFEPSVNLDEKKADPINELSEGSEDVGNDVATKESTLHEANSQEAEPKNLSYSELTTLRKDQDEIALQPQPEPCTRKPDPLPVRNTPSLQSLLDSLQDDVEIKTQQKDEPESVAVKTVASLEQVNDKTQVKDKNLVATSVVEKSQDATYELKQPTIVADSSEVKTAVNTCIKPDTDTKIESKLCEQLKQQAVLTAEKPESKSAVSKQATVLPEDLLIKRSELKDLEKTENKPQELNWHKLELPDEFQVLFFLVKGVRFAVPLVNLGGIFEVPKLTKIAGRPVWYKGMADVRGTKLSLVDTMRWVKPEDSTEHDYQYMIVLDNSVWALGCDELEGNRVLRGDQIKFREKAGSRPWLAGIVKKEMCALLHVQALTAMFERGMGLCSVSADHDAYDKSQN